MHALYAIRSMGIMLRAMFSMQAAALHSFHSATFADGPSRLPITLLSWSGTTRSPSATCPFLVQRHGRRRTGS